jgi:hypothetical protein
LRRDRGKTGIALLQSQQIGPQAEPPTSVNFQSRGLVGWAKRSVPNIAQPMPLSLRAIHVSGKHGSNPAGIRKSDNCAELSVRVAYAKA